MEFPYFTNSKSVTGATARAALNAIEKGKAYATPEAIETFNRVFNFLKGKGE
jgi:hypothetical protein